MSNPMDRDRATPAQKAKLAEQRQSAQLTMFDNDGKARSPEHVKTHHDLPSRWARWYELYLRDIKSRHVADAETERHALAMTLWEWRKANAEAERRREAREAAVGECGLFAMEAK